MRRTARHRLLLMMPSPFYVNFWASLEFRRGMDPMDGYEDQDEAGRGSF